MSRRFYLVGTLLLAGACADAPTATSRAPDPSLAPSRAAVASQHPRYVVMLRDDVSRVPETVGAMEMAHATRAEFVYTASIKGFAARLSPQAIVALQRDPRVLLVEPEKVVTLDGTQFPTPSWGLDRVDQRNLPLDTTFTFARTGFGVHFYGIDTGILGTHAEFSGRLQPGFTAVADGNGTSDCHGHGTHTASTAAGTTYGVAKEMTIVPVRVLDCTGYGTNVEVIAGIDWVTANRVLPAVANMSLGYWADAPTDSAVARSVAAGVVYTVSAGNKSTDACLFSPARAVSALTVGATDASDFQSSFSNWGSCLDLYAPGVNITGAWIGSTTATNTISGTSMSAPHVAGTAGQYLEAHPTATPADVATALTANATPNKILNPGAGSPNLIVFTGGIPANLPPVADFTWRCVAHVCTMDASSSFDADGSITAYTWSIDKSKKTSSGQVLTTTLNGNRARLVTLTITDNSRATASVTHSVQP
ncbi:MAG TPA: S8 family serine peptidase [Gemmatimonadaceae bacterium]|nr:S8 family serine peptidase [Gemmatimonadaceae bacterium]